jgi:VIT1/CCC1 family predicted Fe2+/Mn2+ transporter
MDHSHSPKDIEKRLNKGPSVNYLRDWIYGGIDGAVTTFAIMAGVVGAELSTGIVLVLGVANLVADGFSMAASNYSGTKSEHDDYERIKDIELRHIRNFPQGEIEEVRQIYKRKGYEGEELEKIVELIISKEEMWIEVMLAEEYGIGEINRSPMKAAIATFIAFAICGAVPLIPFIFGLDNSALIASIMVGFVFLAIGAAKSLWSMQSWWASAIETFVIGMSAAGIAYGIGLALKALV